MGDPLKHAKEPGEVLTLSEAAAHLRVAEADLLRLVHEQALPGRQLGADWRFLKPAIQDWLRSPGMKESLLRLAGAWKDDPHVEDMLKQIYLERGRPMTPEGS